MVLKTCPICGRQFSKSEHFKRHQHTHTGKRPFQCFVCKKRYTRRDVLDRHIRGHSPAAVESATAAQQAAANNIADQDDPNETSSVPIARDNEPSPSGLRAEFGVSNSSTAQNVLQPSCPGQNQASDTAARQIEGYSGIIDEMANSRQVDLPLTTNEEHVQRWALEFSTGSEHPMPPYNFSSQVPSHDFLDYDDQFAFENDLSNVSRIGGLDRFMDHDIADMAPAHLLESERRDCGFSNSIQQISSRNNSHLAEDENLVVETPGGTTDSIKSIPISRFNWSERNWPLKSPKNLSRSMEILWQDIISMPMKNIFCEQDLPPFTGHNPRPRISRWALDETCKTRLEAFHLNDERYHSYSYQDDQNETRLSQLRSLESHSPQSSGGSLGRSTFLKFPPTRTVEMALDLFFRHFHPLMPFIHVPTFTVETASPSFLFLICLVGLVIIGTPGATAFVSQAFPNVLGKVIREVNEITTVTDTTAQLLSTVASALLVTNLAAMTGEKEHIQQCQTLYVTMIVIAQRHGLFTVNSSNPLDMRLLDSISDPEHRWLAWCRVESAKRLIVSLVTVDSWFATLFHTSPIIRTDTIQILLPCDDELFNAESATKWAHLVQAGKPVFTTPIISSFEGVIVPKSSVPLNSFCMVGLLSMIQLPLSEMSHRLVFCGEWGGSPRLEPWQLFERDARCTSMVPLIVKFGDTYGDSLQTLNPGCMILWHHICMMLTVNERVLKVAAGCAGAGPAKAALEALGAWSQTASARRACVHAGHTLKLMLNRKASEGSMIHSAPALFTSALVLCLYIFLAPPDVEEEGVSLEILGDVDWKRIGMAGLTREPNLHNPTQHSASFEADDIATKFIKKGGTVYMAGTACHSGPESARRLLTEYAILLDSMKMWTLSKFSRVLQAMSDVLVET